MERDDLDGLVVLKLVADAKSFARAATALNVTASAVSQIIKQLEARLGVALLSRTTRSVTLTEVGEKFLTQIGPALEQISSALTDVGTLAQKPTGLLRLNLPKMVFWTYLEPLVASFLKAYPDVSVELVLDDAQADMVGGGFDAGIRLSDILSKDMIAIKLYGPVRFVTVAAPKYFTATSRPKHPRELLSHNCLRGRLGNSVYDNWEFESRGKEFSVQVKGSLIINDSLALIEAAINGFGVAYVDERSVEKYVKTKKLEVILESFAASSAGYYLYFPKHAQSQPKLRAFVQHLKSANENPFQK